VRYVSYPSKGKPSALTRELDELVMLLQASIEIANAERWALEIGDAPAPASLQQTLRRSAYEVTVVDVFHRVARRYFDRHGFRAVWERPFHTGRRGRPESADISLFDSTAGKETRLELGLYSKAKLTEDAQKLVRLTASTLEGYETIENLVMLWDVKEEKLTKSTSSNAMAEFKRHAAAVRLSDRSRALSPLIASSIDLFVARSGSSRRATVGLFKVTD
jgi:hypothetical protein